MRFILLVIVAIFAITGCRGEQPPTPVEVEPQDGFRIIGCEAVKVDQIYFVFENDAECESFAASNPNGQIFGFVPPILPPYLCGYEGVKIYADESLRGSLCL